eukprot:m.188648 g.188648  ORF g.188648 m.188648 type:complete len:102 (-) comp14788_c0_seq1:131-436(-)
MVEVNVALVDDEFDGYKLSSGTPLVQHLVAAPAPFTPQPHSSDTALVCVEAFALHNTVLATCEDCILYLSKLDGLVFLNVGYITSTTKIGCHVYCRLFALA